MTNIYQFLVGNILLIMYSEHVHTRGNKRYDNKINHYGQILSTCEKKNT